MARFEIGGIRLDVPRALLTSSIRRRLESGDYEKFEAASARRLVQAGNRVLELGTGAGFVTNVCAMAAGPANVVTVEANPDLLPVIRRNLRLNGNAAATVLHGAVGGHDAGATLAFRQSPAFWASAIADGTGRGPEIEVPVLRLPDLLAEYRPAVVIMDIEGAEADLFDAPWPDHVQAVLMELHPKRYPDTVIGRIFDTMSESGLIYAPFLSRGPVVGFRRRGLPPI
ncbi:FkbM family methyltransferase [Jannaschia sp. S6380]|uniref:FkbM family methyltransferase n=1 Tax=Jannaschia sp. S6380 TaxID=2926408 RepID=UPI001FF3FB0D|nr:FkbM family methyltransferase [Jannaschia sp. S6380]